MPWRNGGGTTTELLVEPGASGREGLGGREGANERFLYRLSIADVACDGPFSRFEGYDRHIMLLSGRGMTLDAGPHGRIDLTTPLEPRSFSGDWDVNGVLVGGAVRDFNLIVDRSRARASLSVRRLVAEAEVVAVPSGSTCIVHVLEGMLTDASTHETLVLDATHELVPHGAACVALALITPLRTHEREGAAADEQS